MNDQMTNSNPCDLVADEFIQRVNPYESRSLKGFDLRGYDNYITDHHLSHKDITPEVMKMFASDDYWSNG